MKAFVVEHYGKDGLRAADVPEPAVGDRDVLVKVSAAEHQPAGQDGPRRRVQAAPEVPDPVRARPRRRRRGDQRRLGRTRLPGRRRGLRSPPRPADRDLRAVHRDRPGRRRPQASLAHPARGGRGAAGVTGRLAGPRRPRPRAARPEGPRPRRLRRPGVDRHPARQAPRRHGGDDRARRERGAGAQPRRRRRRRLHQGGLRRGPLRLRRRDWTR